jgi:translocator protein
MKIIKLIIAILIPLFAGFIGSYFTMPAIPGWYAELVKPELNPPSWIFAPVWTTLYIGIFTVQMMLNTTWSIFFFGLQRLDVAFVNIILLWIFILLMIIFFYRISKVSAYLLLPYILWVSFAAYLNYSIWMLN